MTDQEKPSFFGENNPGLRILYEQLKDRPSRKEPVYPGEIVFDAKGAIVGVYCGGNHIDMTDELIWKKEYNWK